MMVQLTEYLLKLSISLSVIYLFYYWVLRRLTFYNWNRWYLLSYTLLSFFIPLIDISRLFSGQGLEQSHLVQWLPVFDSLGNKIVEPAGEPMNPTFQKILGWLLLTGMSILLFRFALQLISFQRMVRKAQFVSGDAMKLYQIDEPIIPFSFGNSIFINRHQHTQQELQEIIRHEFVHVKQRHSIDIIWSEILCLLNWYNPFVWLIRRSIRQNLEFIADHKVLENGVDRKEYQYLLLKVIGNNHFSIAPKFNFSSLKKRIAMMNKMQSTRMNRLRFLFIVPLLAVILVSFRKQISESFTQRKNPLASFSPLPADTVPRVTTPNSKGYLINIIDVKGSCTVLVQNKQGKEVKRVSLNDWTDGDTEVFGEIPPPPPAKPAKAPVPSVPAEPYAIAEVATPLPRGYNPPAWTNICKEFEITETRAVMHLLDGKTETYDLTSPEQKAKFESKYGKVLPSKPPYPVEGVAVGALTAVSGYPVIVPSAPTPEADAIPGVAVIDDYGHVITGNEDIIIIITNKTSRTELDNFKRQMKEKGVELDFDEVAYDAKGVILNINGTMRAGGSQSNFSASDFTKLILAMIRKGDRTYFKVSVRDGKEVI